MDLFYLTDLTLNIRVGDLVIVEADWGKDLGTVVNDTITLKEVEVFEQCRDAHTDQCLPEPVCATQHSHPHPTCMRALRCAAWYTQ